MLHTVCEILHYLQYARRKSAKIFKKLDKNDEAYVPETEQFQQKLEQDQKRKAKKRKSSSNLTERIKQVKIQTKSFIIYTNFQISIFSMTHFLF